MDIEDDWGGDVDEDGKARYGVPGPGSYTRVGAFGETVVYETGAAYSFGTKPQTERQQPFISRQHSKQVCGVDSPGPIYAPHVRGTRPDLTRPIAFSTAERDGEGKKWISNQHISHLLSKTTPGPGTYRNPQKVQMHQPTFKFPTAERPDPTSRSHLFNPGPGQYTLPGSTAVPTKGTKDCVAHNNPQVYWAPKVSFAPSNSDPISMKAKEELRKKLHTSKVPGPGEYAFKTTIGMEQKTTYKDTARNYRKDPAVSIPTTGRDQREKVYISKQHYVADHCSPGPIYTREEGRGEGKKYGEGGLSFAKSRRFYREELGPSHKGPFISNLHSETTGPGSDSPGPAKYAHEGPPGRGQLGDGPKIGVGTAKRFTDKEGTSWVPGPGAYATHNTRIENTGHNHGMGKMFRRDPAFSMASCIRTDFTNLGGVRDNPAPIYEVCAVEERRRNRVNATKFGKASRATNDKIFISKAHAEMDGAAHNTTPGPGKYMPEEAEHRRYGKGPAVKFGQAKNGNDINADLKRSLAKQKAIKEAIDPVPGPGHYKFKEGKMLNITHAHTKFGKATRATDSKIFISKTHAEMDGAAANDAPGPGAYTPKGLSGHSNRYKNVQGPSFGTSKRPPPYTVKF